MDNDVLPEGFSAALMQSLANWPNPTAEQVRNALLEGRIITPTDPDDKSENSQLLTDMMDAFSVAVSGGRMFDLGSVPNKLLISESTRGGQLFAGGHIGHPFTQPYALFHHWEGKAGELDEASGCLYVVDPLDWHAHNPDIAPNSFMVCEAQTVTAFTHKKVLVVTDATIVAVHSSPTSKTGLAYSGRMYRGMVSKGSGLSDAEVICNLVDPVMACLLLLATEGVAVDRLEPSPKLNKAREKTGKTPIPPHWKVHTGEYVTALLQRGQRRSTPGDGHHASPVPHLRRGHIRHMHEMHGGGTRWIADALVNLKDENAPLARSFYQLQRGNEA